LIDEGVYDEEMEKQSFDMNFSRSLSDHSRVWTITSVTSSCHPKRGPEMAKQTDIISFASDACDGPHTPRVGAMSIIETERSRHRSQAQTDA